jgi:hypothetical protein
VVRVDLSRPSDDQAHEALVVGKNPYGGNLSERWSVLTTTSAYGVEDQSDPLRGPGLLW